MRVGGADGIEVDGLERVRWRLAHLPAAADLLGALDEVERAERWAMEARAEVRDRERTVSRLLALLLPRLGVVAMVELVADLYWHVPQVRVADLAYATGLSPAGVRRLAGPLEVEFTCRRCGERDVAWLDARSDPRPRTCGWCREEGELRGQ